jgi:hypothetical protein
MQTLPGTRREGRIRVDQRHPSVLVGYNLKSHYGTQMPVQVRATIPLASAISGLFRPRVVTIANCFFVRWPLAAVAKIDTSFRFPPNHLKAAIEQSNSRSQRYSTGGRIGRSPPGV